MARWFDADGRSALSEQAGARAVSAWPGGLGTLAAPAN